MATPLRLAVAAALLAGVVHVGALGNGFAYDDEVLILQDPGLRDLSALPERLMEPSWPALTGDQIGAWRPVTTGVWAVTYVASGGSALAFHALGLLLHAGVTAMVVLLVARLATLGVAAAAGALFAVHPVHVEAVANVAGSAESISALLMLSACVVHVRGGRSYGLARTAVVTGLYALTVLAKEGGAVLPLLLFLIDGARRDTDWRGPGAYVRDRGILYACLAAALGLVLLYRLDVVGAVAVASLPGGGAILAEAPRSWTVFSIWPHYVRLLFFPMELSASYDAGVIPIVFGWTPAAVLGAGLGLATFGGAWWLWRHSAPLDSDRTSPRLAGLALLWMPAALLPVANVLYVGPVLAAERNLYVASVGAVVLVAWLAVRLHENVGRRALWAVAALVVAGGARTMARVPAWDDTESIMEAQLEARPESGTGWQYVARRLSLQGRQREALQAYAYAVDRLNSDYPVTTELASHLMAMNRPESARFFLKRAWRERPWWSTAPGLLASVELGAGRPQRAAAAARAAALLQPTNPSTHHLLAQSLAALGDWDGAVRARRAALDAGFAGRGRTWLLLAADHVEQGDTAAAAAALDSAALRELGPQERASLADLRSRVERPGR